MDSESLPNFDGTNGPERRVTSDALEFDGGDGLGPRNWARVVRLAVRFLMVRERILYPVPIAGLRLP